MTLVKKVTGNLKDIISEKGVFQMMPFIFFLTFLGILYIGFNYRLEKTQKTINKITSELRELDTEYLETQTQINALTRQSEIIEKVTPFGLQELTESPKVIIKR